MSTRSQPTVSVMDGRRRLSDHLDAIKRQRNVYDEAQAQDRRLHQILKAEADAKTKLDSVRARDASELAEQLANPTGRHLAVNHCDQVELEWDLAEATREADAARACRTAVLEHLSEISRQIAALEQRSQVLAIEVMIEESRALAAEVNAEAKRLRAKYARLWALRNYVGDTPAVRRRFDDVPLPAHPDHIAPDGSELWSAYERWRAYAVRLAVDPRAEFKE